MNSTPNSSLYGYQKNIYVHIYNFLCLFLFTLLEELDMDANHFSTYFSFPNHYKPLVSLCHIVCEGNITHFLCSSYSKLYISVEWYT